MNKKEVLILIAEDDDDFYTLSKEAFGQFSLLNEVRRVSDGEELMDYLLRRGKYGNPVDSPRPGVIFLDLNMPRKNGLEALKEIKSHPELCRIPVIILTVSRDKRDILQSYALGANSFVTKPSNFQELVEILRVFKRYWLEIVVLPDS